MRRLLLVAFVCGASPSWAADSAQPPTLKAPERGSLAGEYATVELGAADLARGEPTIAGPFEAPNERGELLASVFPSYSPHVGITEFGVGWSASLSITRFRPSGPIDYQTDELLGPWGRMQRGADGNFYPVGLASPTRLEPHGDTLDVYTADGNHYTFGGTERLSGARGTLTWYLTDVVTPTGRATHIAWLSGTPSGRRFVDTVSWGGRGADLGYRITFAYENLPLGFTSYGGGVESLLDRRVKTITVAAKNVSTGAFVERWHYDLSYQSDPWGPAFFLQKVQRTFASGEQAPPATYQYSLSSDWLMQAQFRNLPELQPVLQQLGGDIIQGDRSTMFDPLEAGLVQLESAASYATARRGDAGWVVDPPLPTPADVYGGCRRPPADSNPPRAISTLLTGDATPGVIDAESDAGGTETTVSFCDREGQLQAQQTLPGDFSLGANGRLVDLDRDQQPELLRVGYGFYEVAPNQSTPGHLQYGAPQYGTLAPAFEPVATWVQDMNGDGVADLVSRDDAQLVVWLGRGDLTFVSDGQVFVLDDNGAPIGSLSGYQLTFLDANHDGLMDLLLSQAGSFYLFINNGYWLEQHDLPALLTLDANAGTPVFADLAASGNAELTVVRLGEAMGLSLDQAGTALLSRADDGKGTVLSFEWTRAPAQPHGGGRPPVMSRITVDSSGYDAVTRSFAYAGATLHSIGRFLLGYTNVTRSDALGSESIDFLVDDVAPSLPLHTTRTDAHTPGVVADSTVSYDSITFQGLPWYRKRSETNGWRGTDGHLFQSRTDYLSYGADVCPSSVQTVSSTGTLTVDTVRASVAGLSHSLHCLEQSVTQTGSHPDKRLDFRQQVQFTRNDAGLVTSSSSVGGSTLVLSQTQYNPDFTVAQTSAPGRGASTFSYGPAGLLQRLTAPDGVVTSVARDPVTDAITSLTTDRGGGQSYTQSFVFDGQERLARGWDTLGQATAQNPSFTLAYRYATATTPASIARRTLVDSASSAVEQSVEWQTAAGETFGQARRNAQGWALGALTERSRAKAETTQVMTSSPLGATIDPTQQSFGAITATAQTLSDELTGTLGFHDRRDQVQSGVERRVVKSRALAASALVETEVENGAFTTTRWLDEAGRVLALTDAGDVRYGYEWDLLGRLRRVDLPDGASHFVDYDDHGRVTRVSRDRLAQIVTSYDPVSGLPVSQLTTSADGTLTLEVTTSYDGIGRKLAEVHRDHASGATETFSYGWDAGGRGLLSSVNGDRLQKTFVYRPDGKLAQRVTSLDGWRSIESDFTWAEGGALRERLVTVRDGRGAVLESHRLTQLFDAFGRPSGTHYDGAPLSTLAYDANDALIGASFAGGESVTIDRDPLTRGIDGLDTVAARFRADTRMSLDPRGLVAAETLTLGNASRQRQYSYAPQGFLTGSTDAVDRFDYGFDPFGLPTDVVQNGVTRALAAPAVDALGRATQLGELALVYGANGQLAAATKANHQYQWLYDEDGQRVLKIVDGTPTTAYLEEGFLDENALTEPLSIGGLAVGVMRAGQLILLPADLRGSVYGDSDGTARFASPFGDRAIHPDLAAAIDFVQKGWDPDLGLVRMGVRDYDPSLNRFLSPDPLVLGKPDLCVDDPTACNLYGYARSNPLAWVDPKGTYEEPVHGALTYRLALAAGFNERDAAHLALATAAVDHSVVTEPTSPGNIISGITKTIHFDLESGTRYTARQLGRGAGTDLTLLGLGVHTLEDVSPGGPHTFGIHFFGIAHGIYTTEKGHQSWWLSHVSDHAFENPTAYRAQLRNLYDNVIKPAANITCGCQRSANDEAAYKAIDQIVNADDRGKVDSFLYGKPDGAEHSYADWVDMNGRKQLEDWHLGANWSAKDIDNSVE